MTRFAAEPVTHTASCLTRGPSTDNLTINLIAQDMKHIATITHTKRLHDLIFTTVPNSPNSENSDEELQILLTGTEDGKVLVYEMRPELAVEEDEEEDDDEEQEDAEGTGKAKSMRLRGVFGGHSNRSVLLLRKRSCCGADIPLSNQCQIHFDCFAYSSWRFYRYSIHHDCFFRWTDEHLRSLFPIHPRRDLFIARRPHPSHRIIQFGGIQIGVLLHSRNRSGPGSAEGGHGHECGGQD